MRLTKKTGKRSLAMLLLGVMLVGSLGACGKGEDWRSREVSVIDDNYRTWYEIFERSSDLMLIQ